MARLHLREFAENSSHRFSNCMMFASTIVDGNLNEMYVPITGHMLKNYLDSKRRIYFPITSKYSEITPISGFSGPSYNAETSMILLGNDDVLLLRNFVFKKSNMLPIIGKYAVYKIGDDGVAVYSNRYVFLLNTLFFDNVKNTKLKNFLLTKFIPSVGSYSGYVRMLNYEPYMFHQTSLNINPIDIENSVKYSYFDMIVDNYDMNHSSGDNCLSLLKELRNVCSKECIDNIMNRIPNYCEKMTESEIKSLSLPEINR